MYHIAICDDDCEVIEKVEKIIETNYSKKMECDVFQSAEELISHQEMEKIIYDIYLLDIEMGEISGLELAKKIREDSKNCVILFMSNHHQYVYDTFDVKPRGFIRKPITKLNLMVEIDKVLNDLLSENTSFHFEYRKKTYSIISRDILYIEKRGRKATLHTSHAKRKTYDFNMKMDDIRQRLDSMTFVQITQSIIINLHHVASFEDGYVYLCNGERIYISGNYRAIFKKGHMEYVRIRF